MTIAPDRTLEQRRRALAFANEIRSYRAQLKHDIHDGLVDGRKVILEPDGRVLTMKVYDLLLAMPGVGRTKANKAMNRSRTAHAKTVGGLSDRQRREILEWLAPSDYQLKKLAA